MANEAVVSTFHQAKLSAQYQGFTIDLTPKLLLQIMAEHSLKAGNISGQYSFQMRQFESLAKNDLFLQASHTASIENLAKALVNWPAHVSWAEFYEQMIDLMEAWLLDYRAGAGVDTAILTARCLHLSDNKHSHNLNLQFHGLLTHLFARICYQFDQYKFDYLQNFDEETGLPNQQFMLKLINQRLQEGHDKSHLGLMLVNLNINLDETSQLHAAPAELMNAAVQTIQEHLHDNATLFRIGPSELAIVIEQLNFPAQLNLIAARLAHAFESALPLDNITLILKPFFGCIGSFQGKVNAIALYDHARLALHHAMVNNYQIEIYDQQITAAFSNRHLLDEAIIEALQQNELESYLQPIVTLPNEICVNAEILLRWQSGEWKMVSAVRLVDTIYKKGFGKLFIRWLINTACQHVAQLMATHQRDIALTLNLSVTDLLDADLPELLAQSIALWDIPAQNLIIEITEGDFLVDEEKAAQTINQIVALGCKLALDDFGTGYSSMTRLRTMPIDLVKIDQSFVRNIANSPEDREIVQSVVKLAHSLGKQVVAEGVEDKACLDILRQMQCEKIQGYYYAKPMSFQEFSAWLGIFSTRQALVDE